ncbi:MAG TPA: hypothetical protein VG319_02350 [Polyangia bacterium]|jgi:hypothetical protein|nr:hypothetical protein [Polyangia bacterium]
MRRRRRRRGLAFFVAGAAALLGQARHADAAPDAELVAALDAAGGGDVVAFELPAPPRTPHIRAATVTDASMATVLAVLGDQGHYRALLPSLVRSEEIGQRGATRVVAWELEIPLFNLSGTLELRPRAGGFELALTDGDFSPGRLVFDVAPRADGHTTVTLDARLDVARSSFFLRRIMARSDWGEPAALSAAAWVVLRATTSRAEHPHDAAAFRPTTPPAAPLPGQPDGRALFRPAFAPLAARGAVALVNVAPSGRLANVAVSVESREAPAALVARLAAPRSWGAFPGWRHVRPMPATATSAATVSVEDGIPFVDFDATWRAATPLGSPWWIAVEGAARGAWFGWEVSSSVGATQAVLTMDPRLEATGTIPRRFIEAEPLLEQGMSLALTFVDAVSATRGGAK